MNIEMQWQWGDAAQIAPTESDFQCWVVAALVAQREASEVVIRVVGEVEGEQLNERYRQASGPTNVLSFPFSAPPGITLDALNTPLGDLVICAPVVVREAQSQHKPLHAHWAHLVVHGILHLQGYDHQESAEAEQMEALEINILSGLGFANPYLDPLAPKSSQSG